MDITPFVDGLRHDLTATAATAGDEAGAVAERLLLALQPAARLALMEAVSQAAAEITAEMPDGSVEVRLDGRDLAFVVDAGIPTTEPPEPSGPTNEEDDDGEMTRVTLRIPEGVKSRAEDHAATAGQSLNTWLVQCIRTATKHTVGDGVFGVHGTHGGRHGRHIRGWL